MLSLECVTPGHQEFSSKIGKKENNEVSLPRSPEQRMYQHILFIAVAVCLSVRILIKIKSRPE